MGAEKVYRCDLCGEYIDVKESSVLRVGKRDWRPEDCIVFDVGPDCEKKPISELLALAAERDAGFVH